MVAVQACAALQRAASPYHCCRTTCMFYSHTSVADGACSVELTTLAPWQALFLLISLRRPKHILAPARDGRPAVYLSVELQGSFSTYCGSGAGATECALRGGGGGGSSTTGQLVLPSAHSWRLLRGRVPANCHPTPRTHPPHYCWQTHQQHTRWD